MQPTRAVLLLAGLSLLFPYSLCAQRGGHGGGASGRAGRASGHGSGHFSSHSAGRSTGRTSGTSAPRGFAAPRFHSMPHEARGVMFPSGRGNFSPLPFSAPLPSFGHPQRITPAVPRQFVAPRPLFPLVRNRPFFNFGFGFPIDRRFFGLHIRRFFPSRSFAFFGSSFFCDPFFFPCFDSFFFTPLAAPIFPAAFVTGTVFSAASSRNEDESLSRWPNSSSDEDRTSATSPPEGPVTLLQLTDGSMYGLTDYWVEDGQLRYVTSYGAESSVPLDSVDFAETTRLNSERGLPFSLRENPAPPPHSSAPPHLP